MHTCKMAVLRVRAVVAVSVAGCAADNAADENADSVRDGTETVNDAVTTNPQSSTDAKGGTTNANGAGQCCWGHCTASNAFEFPLLTDGCRAAVVNECHRRGLAFDPNGDAWWGTC